MMNLQAEFFYLYTMFNLKKILELYYDHLLNSLPESAVTVEWAALSNRKEAVLLYTLIIALDLRRLRRRMICASCITLK
jgi:hypothetical protein